MNWYEADDFLNYTRMEFFGDDPLEWKEGIADQVRAGLIPSSLSQDVIRKLQKQCILRNFCSGVRWPVLITIANSLGVMEGDWFKILSNEDDSMLVESYDFDDLKELPYSLAKCLGNTKGGLILGSLSTLNYHQAKELSKSKGSLELSGLTTITEGVAHALGQREGHIYLGGLRQLTPALARALAMVKGNLFLESISTITAKTVDQLQDFRYSLHLDGLEEMNEKTADSFARCKAETLHFYSLLYLSEQARNNLAWFPHYLFAECLEIQGNALELLNNPPPCLIERRKRLIDEDFERIIRDLRKE